MRRAALFFLVTACAGAPKPTEAPEAAPLTPGAHAPHHAGVGPHGAGSPHPHGVASDQEPVKPSEGCACKHKQNRAADGAPPTAGGAPHPDHHQHHQHGHAPSGAGAPGAPGPGGPGAHGPGHEATHGGHAHHGGGYQMDFSEVERFARHFDGPERAAWQKPDEVVRLLELSPGAIVADIGAGTGYFLAPLSRAVGPKGRVLALDVEPNMVEYMKRRTQREALANVEARTVAPDDPGLAANSVDRVLIVNTWHHIGNRTQYATKLAQALRPGGAVYIVDFTRESDIGPPAQHRLSPEQVERELESGGLEAEIVSESLPKQYVVRAHR